MTAELRGWDRFEGKWSVPIEDAVIITDKDEIGCRKVPSMEIEDNHDSFDIVITEELQILVDDIVVWEWKYL